MELKDGPIQYGTVARMISHCVTYRRGVANFRQIVEKVSNTSTGQVIS